jgi:hypothetical protein
VPSKIFALLALLEPNLQSFPTTCHVTFLYRVMENTLQKTAAAAEYPRTLSLELSNQSVKHVRFLSGQMRVTLKIPLEVVTSNLHVCMWRNKSQASGSQQQQTWEQQHSPASQHKYAMSSGYNQTGLEWCNPTFQALTFTHCIPPVLISYSRHNYIVVQNIAG